MKISATLALVLVTAAAPPLAAQTAGSAPSPAAVAPSEPRPSAGTGAGPEEQDRCPPDATVADVTARALRRAQCHYDGSEFELAVRTLLDVQDTAETGHQVDDLRRKAAARIVTVRVEPGDASTRVRVDNDERTELVLGDGRTHDLVVGSWRAQVRLPPSADSATGVIIRTPTAPVVATNTSPAVAVDVRTEDSAPVRIDGRSARKAELGPGSHVITVASQRSPWVLPAALSATAVAAAALVTTSILAKLADDQADSALTRHNSLVTQGAAAPSVLAARDEVQSARSRRDAFTSAAMSSGVATVVFGAVAGYVALSAKPERPTSVASHLRLVASPTRCDLGADWTF